MNTTNKEFTLLAVLKLILKRKRLFLACLSISLLLGFIFIFIKFKTSFKTSFIYQLPNMDGVSYQLIKDSFFVESNLHKLIKKHPSYGHLTLQNYDKYIKIDTIPAYDKRLVDLKYNYVRFDIYHSSREALSEKFKSDFESEILNPVLENFFYRRYLTSERENVREQVKLMIRKKEQLDEKIKRYQETANKYEVIVEKYRGVLFKAPFVESNQVQVQSPPISAEDPETFRMNFFLPPLQQKVALESYLNFLNEESKLNLELSRIYIQTLRHFNALIFEQAFRQILVKKYVDNLNRKSVGYRYFSEHIADALYRDKHYTSFSNVVTVREQERGLLSKGIILLVLSCFFSLFVVLANEFLLKSPHHEK